MDKKKFGRGMQIVALLLFIIMALACATQADAIGAKEELKSSSGSTEGAAIETPVDSITTSYDLALN